MSAKIVIDPGGDPVAGSRVFDSSFVDAPFTLSNQSDSGVAGWKWEFIDTPYVSPTLEPKPAPSFASTLSVTPDVKGWSIFVRLTTYRDPGRTIEDAVDEAVLGIRFDTPNDWLIPPAGEARQVDTDRGWSREVNRILADTNDQIGGGGGGARGREWWNADSTDAGALSGSIVIGSGTFVPEVDRINLWDGSGNAVANMPTLAAGDHNRRIGFLEATGSSAGGLEINAGGTNAINRGAFQGLSATKVSGAGSLYVLQYDEFVDKFRVVYPADNAVDLRATVTEPATISISLPDPVNHNVANSGIDTARLILLAPAVDYAEVTGFDASLADLPGFNRDKVLLNGDSSNRVVLRLDNAGSLAPNRIEGPINDRIVIQPNCAICMTLLGAWFVFDPSSRALEIRRAVVTGNTTPDITGELVLVDATGPVIITPPDILFVGQRFGVQLVAGTSLTVNGVEDPDTGIPGGAVLALRQGFRHEWIWDGAIWALAQQPATNRLRAILNDATNVLAGQAVYINGVGAAHGQPKVTKARANAAGTARFFGAAVADTADTNELYVQADGVLQIPAAQQVGTWNTGDKIYLDAATAGKYTNVAPGIVVPVGWALDTPGGAFCRVWVDRAP